MLGEYGCWAMRSGKFRAVRKSRNGQKRLSG